MNKGFHRDIIDKLNYKNKKEFAELKETGVELSDQTSIAGTIWQNLKKVAMPDNYEFQSWFVSNMPTYSGLKSTEFNSSANGFISIFKIALILFYLVPPYSQRETTARRFA